jgi:hypothetical protein
MISTNWIHIIGFYVTTYLSLIFFQLIGLTSGYELKSLLIEGPLSVLLLFVVYGAFIIGYFYLAIVIMDIIGFSWRNFWINETLILEWFIISIPFIYWAFKYDYWLWLTLSGSFLLTQMIRRKWLTSYQSS